MGTRAAENSTNTRKRKTHQEDVVDVEAGRVDKTHKTKPPFKLSPALYLSLPRPLRLFLDVLLGSMLILLLPLYFAYDGLPAFDLTEYVPRELTWPRVEVVRWAIYLELAWVGFVSSYHSSFMVARVISLFVRRSRHYLAKDTRRVLEFFSFSWHYLGLCLTALLLWTTCLYIFTYPPIVTADGHVLKWAELPWQYYFERCNLIAFVFFIWRALFNGVSMSITISVSRQVYQERVFRCMFGIWVIKVLRDACVQARGIPVWLRVFSRGVRRSPHPSTAPQQFPYSQTDAMSAFLLENIYSAKNLDTEMIIEMFRFLGKENADHLVEEDFAPYVVSTQLFRAFSTFDLGSHGDITEPEFVDAVNKIYQERADLIQSISGHSKLIKKLDGLFTLASVILTFATCYFIFGIDPKSDTSSFISTIVFTLLGKSVGDVLKSLVVSAIYIVNTHPFDVGDRVTIDGAHFFVRKVGLVSTVLDRIDGMRVYFSNYRLANTTVGNIRRITGQCSRFELIFDITTPTSKISLFRARLTDFVKTQQRDYLQVQSVLVELSDCDSVRLVFILKHRLSQQDGTAWRMRNSRFLEHIKEICEDQGIDKPPIMRTVSFD